ncbi:MAG: GntR family transcriptional regulator [Solirubrobacterales bacterium]
MSPSHIPSSTRHSALAPLDPHGRVAEVERRLAEAIDVGVFGEGEQLPSESELSARLGVATVTLREALAGLRRTGLVETRRGRHGGTFVRGRSDARLLDRLAALSVDELRDLADHRTAVAATVAELAAVRASDPDLERLEEHVERLASATGAVERRAADERFHVELAATTRSLRLTRAEMELQAEAGPLVWLVADPARALADHRGVLAAVRARRPRAARERMTAHLAAEPTRSSRCTWRAPPACSARAHRPGARPRGACRRHGAPPRTFRGARPRLHDARAGVRGDRRDPRGGARPAAGAAARRPRAHPRPRPRDPRSCAARRRRRDGVRARRARGRPAVAGVVAARDWRAAGLPRRRARPGAARLLRLRARRVVHDPRDAGERWIAGPFVDHSGTNEHILTLTLPVVRDGRFLGVAGADIAVGAIEPIAAPALAATGADAALLNHRGRVIATNTPRWPVGLLWPGDPARARVERDPRVAWSVVISG